MFHEHQGLHDLRIWQNQKADGNWPTRTPAKVKDSGNEVMENLSKLTKRHHTGRMPRSDWLDRLTFREIELINEREKRTSNYMYLMIEFPRLEYHGVEYTVVYYEKGGDDLVTKLTQSDYIALNDDELFLDNLVEGKHHKLARSVRSGLTDRDLKPDAGTRDQLHAIVESPPTKTLASEEQDLVWRFRFYLSNQKKVSRIPDSRNDHCSILFVEMCHFPA
jgi:phosphatidylinositol 3-kinase